MDVTGFRQNLAAIGAALEQINIHGSRDIMAMAGVLSTIGELQRRLAEDPAGDIPVEKRS